MLAIKIIAGAVIGTICKVGCDWIERKILSDRNLEYDHSKMEDIIFYILMAVAGGVILWRTGSPLEIIYNFAILIICELIAVIDLHHRIIPNQFILAMLIIKIIFGVPSILGIQGFPQFEIIQSLIGFAGGFIIFAFPAVLSKSVGAGDIKLAAAAGFCLGITGLLYAIVLMGICVLGYTLIQSQMPVKTMLHNMIPMGPFIAVAMIVVLNLNY
jgi:leader peptidase (prepilin peptidase)/N-methyltransferase